METVKDVRDGIMKMEKSISLRQIALRSGINYITVRNIRFGKSKRVTEGVVNRFKQFQSTFNADTITPVKRGRKPGVKNAAPTAASAAKKGRRGRRPGARKSSMASPAQAPSGLLMGSALKSEIAQAQARLEYLRILEKAEAAYLKFVGRG